MRLKALVAGIAVVIVAALVVGWEARQDEEENPAVLSIEKDRLRYTYHLVSGQEALFDLRRDPDRLTNLASSRRGEADALRAALAKRRGVSDLEELRHPYDPLRRSLESLGYLR